MTNRPQLRVLSGHPELGRPGDVVDSPENGQAYVDVGLAEWVAQPIERSSAVETTEATPAPEDAARRSTARRRTREHH